MKTRIAFTSTLVFLLLSACSSALTIRETRETNSFSKIEVGGGIDLFLTQDNIEKVEVEADGDIIKNVVTEVKGNTLVVKVKKSNFFSLFKDKDIKVYVTAPEIDEVSISGGADFHCNSLLKCKSSFRMNASGGADGNIDQLITADNVQINVSGGADCEIKDIKTKTCSLSASSGSDLEASVTISEEITINASSGSDVSVSGQAKKVSVFASSGSDVNIRNLSHDTLNSNNSSGADIHK